MPINLVQIVTKRLQPTLFWRDKLERCTMFVYLIFTGLPFSCLLFVRSYWNCDRPGSKANKSSPTSNLIRSTHTQIKDFAVRDRMPSKTPEACCRMLKILKWHGWVERERERERERVAGSDSFEDYSTDFDLPYCNALCFEMIPPLIHFFEPALNDRWVLLGPKL